MMQPFMRIHPNDNVLVVSKVQTDFQKGVEDHELA
jgi:hypothetical protein